MTSRVRLRDWLVGEEGPINQMEEEEEEEEGGEESGSGQESEGSPSAVSFRVRGLLLYVLTIGKGCSWGGFLLIRWKAGKRMGEGSSRRVHLAR